MLDYSRFKAVYDECKNLVVSNLSAELQSEMALHDSSMSPDVFSLSAYLECSSLRFYKAYMSIASKKVTTVCDIGCLGGVFPLVLQRLGYTVSVTEVLKYYSDKFHDFVLLHRESGIEVIDYDPFGAELLGRSFDAVFCLAVLEHYPHSLRQFVKNFRAMVHHGGYAYVEVPLVSYWYKRFDLLFGKSPLAHVSHIYCSETPFCGHHHEYTMDELRYVVAQMGFCSIEENLFTYSLADRKPFWFRVLTRLDPTGHEVGAILCKNRVLR